MDEYEPQIGDVIDLDEMLTDEGKKNIKDGDVLIFQKDGKKLHIKVHQADLEVKEPEYWGEVVNALLTGEELGEAMVGQSRKSRRLTAKRMKKINKP